MIPPTPQHVLMTADTIGGVWTFALELCAGLSARGTSATLVTFGRMPDAQQRASAKAIPNLSLIPTQYRLEWMEDCGAEVMESGSALLALARRLQPDVVHANTYYHATLPFAAPVLLTAHSCVSSWWHKCKGTALPQHWSWYRAWIAEAVRKSDLLVAPTQTYLDEFQALHGSGRRTRVIWNGRSTPVHTATHKEPVVLAAGRLWDEAKNIDMLAHVAEGTNLRIRVAGDAISPARHGGDFPKLETLGRLSAEELAREMRRAAVFAAPARYEPFGLSILEAARAGCALVLSDIPTLRELWDGVAGFVDPDDVCAWRGALAALISDPVIAEARGHAARERSLRYSADRMAEAYCDAYASLFARPKPEGMAA
ncbi:MAG TPA: glycosyltransferase family 4 protein [Rhizomicrobium sp.]|jgi:glycosyltransferase involved in cell wall biosynthesis|nr:glycosyltransferase family 4 protein [Rhizomicrobium sp.]